MKHSLIQTFSKQYLVAFTLLTTAGLQSIHVLFLCSNKRQNAEQNKRDIKTTEQTSKERSLKRDYFEPNRIRQKLLT